jgi:hypothetical protein
LELTSFPLSPFLHLQICKCKKVYTVSPSAPLHAVQKFSAWRGKSFFLPTPFAKARMPQNSMFPKIVDNNQIQTE